MSELINPVPVDEVPSWVRAMATTFLQPPDSEQTENWIAQVAERWDPARSWGVRDQGRWVATLRTEPRMLTVPGAAEGTHELTVDALTAVTVAATHRRRGLMSEMLGASLQAARDRGDALSALIAAEWPIYGRFGYGPATLTAKYTLLRRRPGAHCPGDPSRIRQVERDEFGRLAPQVFREARRQQPGQMDRDERWWRRTLGLDGHARPDGLPHNWFIHEGEAGPDGLLAWTAKGDHGLVISEQKVEVWTLVSASNSAYRDIWAYLTGLDAIDKVTLSERPVSEPVRWMLTDARTLVLDQQVDFLWVALLDVPAALTARRYAAPGEVVLEVTDDGPGGFASGRYRLVADGDAVECDRTEREPDLEISQRALASVYLGGFSVSELLKAGAARERSPGAASRVDLMFSTPVPPWNQTWF